MVDTFDTDFLIKQKSKAFKDWNQHNFIFRQSSEIVFKKLSEINQNFKNVLLITSDLSETIILGFCFLIGFTTSEGVIPNVLSSDSKLLIVQSKETLVVAVDVFKGFHHCVSIPGRVDLITWNGRFISRNYLSTIA